MSPSTLFSRLPRRARIALVAAAALLGVFILIAIIAAASAKPEGAMQSKRIVEKLATVRAKGKTPATGYWSDEVIQPGDSLRNVLERFNLSSQQIQDGAMSRAEIPAEVRDSLRELLSNRLDLYKLEAGDTVRILYQVNYFHGQQISMGDILAVEISHQGKLYRAYYFGEDGNGRYYDEHGQPLKKGFETQPVPGSRISSPFGVRVHPILGYLRMHTGIDYAAPTGTPIHAPSDGIVEFRGPKGGYGNTVILRHNDSMQTLYGHMSAFSANAAPGQRVRAGDIIGFIGTTGRSTGPHLHYEVRLNGVPVNPAGVALPAKRLTTAELAEFRRQQQTVEQKLAQLRGIGKTVAQLD